ncbi:MAG: hypothetical protein UR11_C0001G0331 [Candidatus Woesebacteria bacterium GW2011_GWC1_30_29]|uniref:Uncharacterized protein n=1 Tax=Candidatus Woesebacteria bacterium GW2011_GWC2_31_9 TaxID=1618586 RepID=A0A0F9YKW6_9BACT|nr:MAG: hypothetical protein UR11_C0001G0331 [Candidatus Woesebacteria bacterium GW2011_GWC1_30_29]KKP26126.1 MAG: hypothetical protein UR13_C0005G0009 [Candidatus Woesebacteria bacterium GW2011_GWD1_31_12]KKP27617.1 MAG: hypothetical protein UR16_C0003G0277 [Candidatus Woesebacteria bacterium GW2011_GWB1_31_29]KKP32134.1 MAG: hypothetical protein UR21_C0002G0053 [Candidatus Woesebacteria bacterium GW2011_GWC2_31_9]KKP34326.1 MAG: hypothetical protein UR24_C0001G0391 [Candidatus Woesebacteria b
MARSEVAARRIARFTQILPLGKSLNRLCCSNWPPFYGSLQLTLDTLSSAAWTFLYSLNNYSNCPASKAKGIISKFYHSFPNRPSRRVFAIITRGIEIIIPTIPASLEPIASARSVTIGETPVDFSIIFGTKT